MSTTIEHPNTVEAREHRSAAVMHAARCLYRDHRWLDPLGELAVWDWLTEIPYTDRPKYRDLFRVWLRNAHIDGSTPISRLSPKQRDGLIVQMARFAKGGRS